MSTPEEGLRPEEFAEAAAAAIRDALQHLPHDARQAAQVLAQAGLTGVCAREDDGGLGLDIAFAVPIAHAAGQLQLTFPLVEQLLLARALPGTPEGAALAAGDKIATVAWQGDLKQGLAGPARHAPVCDWALVPDGEGAALIGLNGLKAVADTALDPDHPAHWLHTADAVVLARLDADAWATLQHQARLLMAALANGAADGALDAAVQHTVTRVQFGRPLAARQAVRHHLARMKLVQEVSAAAIRRVLSANEYGQARASHTALTSTLANAAFVIEKAIHLHGGMGFTWAVPLHRALREVRQLDAALGADQMARHAGRQFIEAA